MKYQIQWIKVEKNGTGWVQVGRNDKTSIGANNKYIFFLAWRYIVQQEDQKQFGENTIDLDELLFEKL